MLESFKVEVPGATGASARVWINGEEVTRDVCRVETDIDVRAPNKVRVTYYSKQVEVVQVDLNATV